MYNTEEGRKTQRVLNMKDKMLAMAGLASDRELYELELAMEEMMEEIRTLRERNARGVLRDERVAARRQSR